MAGVCFSEIGRDKLADLGWCVTCPAQKSPSVNILLFLYLLRIGSTNLGYNSDAVVLPI